MDILLSFFIFFPLCLTKRGGEKLAFFPELAEMTTDGAIHLCRGQERRGNSPRRREESAGDFRTNLPLVSVAFPSGRVSESFRRDDRAGERHFHCSGAAERKCFCFEGIFHACCLVQINRGKNVCLCLMKSDQETCLR